MANTEICQKCKTAVANVKVTQVVNGKKKQWTLCESCAKMTEELHSIHKAPACFKKFMENMFGPDEVKESSLQCPNCRLTARQFEKSGLLGCEECYRTFGEELGILLQRIHGSNKHIGSRPRPERVVGDFSDLDAMKSELEKAIKNENYELAAKYRDMIRDQERELKHRKKSGKRGK